MIRRANVPLAHWLDSQSQAGKEARGMTSGGTTVAAAVSSSPVIR
jgi:hypothetical protein